MAVTGTLTRGRKIRWMIYMVLSAGFSAYCYYDGWINPKYQTPAEASNRLFNQTGAVVLAVLFVVLVAGFFRIRKTRVVLDEAGIDVNGKFRIPWPAVTRVDSRNLDKGLLDIFYKDGEGGSEKKYTLDGYKTTGFDAMIDEFSVRRPDLLQIEGPESQPSARQ